MRIENVNAVNMGMKPGMTSQGMDAASRNIQNQIREKQQELQKLSGNEEMSMEEKMKKRQSIQKEISDLNMQLRQHQMEQRKEQQQSKGASMDDMLGGRQRVSSQSKKGQNAGMSQTAMTAMISAYSSMKQARVQGNAAEQNEGRAAVLKAEIKQDAALGGDTGKKEEELAKAEQRAADAADAQMSTLGEANKTMEEAADRKDDVSGNEDVQRTEEAQNTGLLGKAEGDKSPKAYRSTSEYKNFLTEKYDCLKSKEYSVEINGSLAAKAAHDQKTAQWLEYNLSLIPGAVEKMRASAEARGTKVLSCNIKINGYDDMTTEIVTQDVVETGTEKAKKELEEKIKKAREEKKIEEEKAAENWLAEHKDDVRVRV